MNGQDASAEVTSLILRFRDLTTPAGETIARHRAIAEAKGAVWWGWWNKAGETVPADLYIQLNKTKPFKLHLFDSGSASFFEADCQEIQFSTSGAQMPSPQPDETPEYYASQTYYAWFRLSNIGAVPVDSKVCRAFTYVRVDDFFSTQNSRYGKFYGKCVASAEELRQQDRTIWFVRPRNQSDPCYEIQLLDAYNLAPAHFPPDFIQRDARTLLWLSDLHVSEHAYHFPLQPLPEAQD